MILGEIISKSGRNIALTSERWNHIVLRHPEMSAYLEEVKMVLQNPTVIIQDYFDQNIKFYQKYYKEEKCYITLVIEEQKGFIITAYTTNSPKRGYILWQKK